MLAVLAVALAAAFVVAPRMLAGIGGGGFAGRRSLVKALRKSLIGYWNSGDRDLSPDLQRVVDYWLRYHLAKAAIAAILLVVLFALGVLIWKAFLTVGGLGTGARAVLVSAGGANRNRNGWPKTPLTLPAKSSANSSRCSAILSKPW